MCSTPVAQSPWSGLHEMLKFDLRVKRDGASLPSIVVQIYTGHLRWNFWKDEFFIEWFRVRVLGSLLACLSIVKSDRLVQLRIRPQTTPCTPRIPQTRKFKGVRFPDPTNCLTTVHGFTDVQPRIVWFVKYGLARLPISSIRVKGQRPQVNLTSERFSRRE